MVQSRYEVERKEGLAEIGPDVEALKPQYKECQQLATEADQGKQEADEHEPLGIVKGEKGLLGMVSRL